MAKALRLGHDASPLWPFPFFITPLILWDNYAYANRQSGEGLEVERTHGEQSLKGRWSRFWLLTVGFASILALNAFITWSMPAFSLAHSNGQMLGRCSV